MSSYTWQTNDKFSTPQLSMRAPMTKRLEIDRLWRLTRKHFKKPPSISKQNSRQTTEVTVDTAFSLMSTMLISKKNQNLDNHHLHSPQDYE